MSVFRWGYQVGPDGAVFFQRGRCAMRAQVVGYGLYPLGRIWCSVGWGARYPSSARLLIFVA
eukprot:607301-Lingulodinium_polyedra.AAC.1